MNICCDLVYAIISSMRRGFRNGGGYFLALLVGLAYLLIGQEKLALAESGEFNGLLISPAINSIELSSGESYVGAMVVKNNTSSAMKVTMSVGSYNLDEGDYDNPNYDDIGRYNEIANWIYLDKDNFTLETNESTTVKYRIAVPDDVPDGEQYAVIFASVGDSRVGMFIKALMIDSNIANSARIANMTPIFQWNKSPRVGFLVTNTGNVINDVSYKVEVKDASTDEVVYKTQSICTGIYPGTTRYLNIDVDDEIDRGVYNIELSVSTAGENRIMKRTIILEPLAWYVRLYMHML